MFTPQEVSEKAFPKASFGGYNMSMVDEFLDTLTQDYTTLYKENATLKGKMKVLADKVEEYRSTEDAMRKTLMTAQRMADDIVAEAETKKADLLFTTEQAAKARTVEISKQMQEEEERLVALKASVANYVTKLKALYQHEMDYLHGLGNLVEVMSPVAPVAPVTPIAPVVPVATPEDYVAMDIAAAVERTVAMESTPTPPPAPPQQEVEPQSASLYTEILELKPKGSEEEDASAATQRIDFGKLQFGKDYEIR